jgi:NB-ARC domain-containing protein
MPNRTGSKPAISAMKRFGARLAQHLEEGTRPPGSRKAGKWGDLEFAKEAGRGSDRTVTNWCKGRNLPPDYEPIEFALFGKDASKDTDAYRLWRNELRKLFEEADAEKKAFSDENALKKIRGRSGEAAPTETGPTRVNAPATVPASPATGSIVAQRSFSESARRVFPPADQMPRVPRLFMGRDDLLREIEDSLKRNGGRVAVTALHGLRGVGKTTLAAAYAERQMSHYRVIWWVRAENESSLRDDLIALVRQLMRFEGSPSQQPSALGEIMEALGHEWGEVLVIFDNAIDTRSVKRYLPRVANVHTLITSNSDDWREIARPIELRPWSPEIGADFLIARTGRDNERVAAQSLSVELGGLPLAHEQAAAYCAHLRVSFSDYQRRFEASPVTLLDAGRYAPIEYRNGQTVAKTFGLAIQEAEKLHPAAASLIFYLAKCPVVKIPRYMLFLGRGKLCERLPSLASDGDLEVAFAALHTFALIEDVEVDYVHDGLPSIQLHRLVRLIAGAQEIDIETARVEDFIVAVLTAAFSNAASGPSDPQPYGLDAYNVLFDFVAAIFNDEEFMSRVSYEAYRQLAKKLKEDYAQNGNTPEMIEDEIKRSWPFNFS